MTAAESTSSEGAGAFGNLADAAAEASALAESGDERALARLRSEWAEEVEAAARQYVRKIAAATPSQMASPAFERAVERVAAATADLLAELPPRRQPPATLPPLRRR